MKTNKIIPVKLVVLFASTLRNHFHKRVEGPITVERLKGCDWSLNKFIEVNFSKLTDSDQIFRNDFVFIHYDLCKISPQIIECKIFWSI